MSVMSARAGRPLPAATSTIACASSRAASRSAMNAPEPALTSITSASRPAASFLDRIEATISGSDSTVRGRVADRVQPPVGRRQVAGLADDRAARVRDRRAQALGVGRREVAGDRLELVERAAGVAEAAAGDHRHRAAARGDHRREQQRDLVADAAGRVLVERGAGQPGLRPVEDLARAHHRAGQRDALVAGHALAARRPSRTPRPARRSRQPSVIPRTSHSISWRLELAAVALAADELLGEHRAAVMRSSRVEEVVDQRARADAEALRASPSPAPMTSSASARYAGRLLGGADAARGLDSRRGRRRARPRASRAPPRASRPAPTLPVEVFEEVGAGAERAARPRADRVARRRASRSRGSP